MGYKRFSLLIRCSLGFIIFVWMSQCYVCYCQGNNNSKIYQFITPQQAHSLFVSACVDFIDVSPYEEYLKAHAQGSKSFSFSRIGEFTKSYPDTNQKYILIGQNVFETVNYLTRKGYNQLYIVSSGGLFENDFNSTNFWEKQSLPIKRWNNFVVGNDTFYVSGLEILRLNNGVPNIIASFPKPTITLLDQYRHIMETHFDDREYESVDLFKEIQGISYDINCTTIDENKIWVGFSFYEGEGYEGYGGIGFYNITSGEIGVLRHPVLVNHSARDISVKYEKIYIQTIDNFESMQGVGNGLIEIDLNNMKAKSLVPPGPNVIWDKDGEENVALYYDKPIEEIITDQRFLLQEVEQYKSEELVLISSSGYENYMIDQARKESESRRLAVLNSKIVVDTLFTLTPQKNMEQISYGDNFWFLFHGETFLCDFCAVSFGADKEYIFFPTSTKGATVDQSDDKFSFTIKLTDFGTNPAKTSFTFIQLQCTIREIR
ncbi:MAG: rhodanese-like domain-containing protein [Bacteroidota bacterium]|nr:rhodanese-like domain-containing protein [Bacteroidota bacterium]